MRLMPSHMLPCNGTRWTPARLTTYRLCALGRIARASPKCDMHLKWIPESIVRTWASSDSARWLVFMSDWPCVRDHGSAESRRGSMATRRIVVLAVRMGLAGWLTLLLLQTLPRCAEADLRLSVEADAMCQQHSGVLQGTRSGMPYRAAVLNGRIFRQEKSLISRER